MLPVKKIYTDSRQSVTDTSNSSDFKIELPYSYKMPPDTVFFICDVCVPHTWWTIEEGSSDKLYFVVLSSGGTVQIFYIATMQPGIYDGPRFQNALNIAIYSVYTGISVTYPGNNALIISITGIGNAIKISTDAEIPEVHKCMINNGKNWIGSVYNGGYVATSNEHIPNFKPLSADTRYVCIF